MSFCLLIANCSKFEHRRRHQCDTWLHDFPLTLWYHVRGNPDQDDEYIFDISEHLLTVKVPDDYLSLSKKTYSAMKAVREYYPNITHILKTEDDMTCIPATLMKLLGTFGQYDYGGFQVHILRDQVSTHHYRHVTCAHPEPTLRGMYANKRFYFVSAKSIDHIVKQKDLFWAHVFEDNTVGSALSTLPDIRFLPVPDKIIFKEY